ncbi:MAG: hypothetical protein HY774_25285 [Acidobacteria bacterium]|nr:hypothetical protein [Acidobacteriota bacterium]
MGNYKYLILILIIALVRSQTCLAQELIKINSQDQLTQYSKQLVIHIQNQERRYLPTYQRASKGIESSFINHAYQSKKYSILIDIEICKDQLVAIEGFKHLFPRSDGAVGMRLAEIGDKAHGWFNGTIYVRKGNVLAFIYVRPRDQGNQGQQAQVPPNPGQPAETNQFDEEPVNRNPNTSTELEIAKRFARHIVGFFEEQAQ